MTTIEERLATLEGEVAQLKDQLRRLQGGARDEPNGPVETGADLARKIAKHYAGIPREVLEEADRLGREALGRGVPDEHWAEKTAGCLEDFPDKEGLHEAMRQAREELSKPWPAASED